MALPPVGVTLIAKDAAQFTLSLEAATKALDNFSAKASASAKTTNDALGQASVKTTGFISNLGDTLKSTTGAFGSFGGEVLRILNPLGNLFDRVFNQILRVTIRQVIRDVEQFIGSLAAAAIAGTTLESDFGRLKASLDSVSKSSFAPLVAQLSSLVEKAAPAFLGIVQAGEEYLGGLAGNALTWGENVVNQFAQGMIDAIGNILSALTSIANLVSYYLSPGSPPRLLPDIDKWGTAAANEFFGGWANADLSVFNDLSSTLGSLIQSIPIPKGNGGQAGAIEQILGARQGIAQAVEELRTTGSVAADTFDRIIKSVGTASAQVRDYLTATIKLQAANANVTAAQDQLNQVTARYNELLKPVDAAIAGITESQQQLADSQKKSLLQLVLADPNASAAQKRNAQLEIEKIDAEARQRALLAEQKTAVDNAQTKLDAAKTVQAQAQDEYNQKLAVIKLDTDQNNLLKQQLQLLQQIAGSGAAPKIGGGAPSFAPFSVKPLDIGKLIPPDLLGKWTAFTTSLGSLWDKIADKFQPTVDAINTLLIPAIQRLQEVTSALLPVVEDEFAKTLAFMISQSAIAGPQIVANVATAVDEIANIVEGHGATFIHAVGFIFRAAFTAATLALTDITASVANFFTVVSTILDVGSLLLQGKWDEALTRLTYGWNVFWKTNLDTATTDLALLANLFGTNLAAIAAFWTGIWDGMNYYIDLKLMAMSTSINTTLTAWSKAFDTTLTGILTAIQTNIAGALAWLGTQRSAFASMGSNLVQGFIDGARALAQAMINAVIGPIQDAIAQARALLGWHSPSTLFAEAGRSIMQGLTQGLAQGAMGPTVALTGVLNGMVSGASNMTYNTTSNFTYSPTYMGGGPQPEHSFATMAALWA